MGRKHKPSGGALVIWVSSPVISVDIKRMDWFSSSYRFVNFAQKKVPFSDRFRQRMLYPFVEVSRVHFDVFKPITEVPKARNSRNRLRPILKRFLYMCNHKNVSN